MQELTLRSNQRQQLLDITDAVNKAVTSWSCPAVLVYCPHTTAGVVVNEHADPDVAHDLLLALDRMVPAHHGYRHTEGNSTAHVKAALVGTSQMLPLRNGKLLLGTWQGVFFAEFDGPRARSIYLLPLPAVA